MLSEKHFREMNALQCLESPSLDSLVNPQFMDTQENQSCQSDQQLLTMSHMKLVSQ